MYVTDPLSDMTRKVLTLTSDVFILHSHDISPRDRRLDRCSDRVKLITRRLRILWVIQRSAEFIGNTGDFSDEDGWVDAVTNHVYTIRLNSF